MFYTYTTPAIPCSIEGADFEGLEFVRIAIKGARTQIVREIPVEDIDQETGAFVVGLTQEETAALGAGQITIQARLRYQGGAVEPTNKIIKQMGEILDRTVI